VILGFYAGKSHNLIGLRIFHGDLDFFDKKSLDLHEKSLDLKDYEIFPHKILKSRTFKKSSILIVIIPAFRAKLDWLLRALAKLVLCYKLEYLNFNSLRHLL
jgi:hypothetical protein